MSEYIIPENVYELLQKNWIEGCLDNSTSLLFGIDDVWTIKNLEQFQDKMLGEPITSSEGLDIPDGDTFLAKLKEQFSKSEDPKIWLLICDLMVLHYCFDSKTSFKRKSERIKKALDFYIESNNPEFDKDTLYQKVEHLNKIEGRARCGQYYNVNIPNGIAYYSWVSLSYKQGTNGIKEEIKNLIDENCLDKWKSLDKLSNEAFINDIKVKYKDSDQKDRYIPHVFAMLHMLAPKYFIDISSIGSKRKIINTFKSFLEETENTEYSDNLSKREIYEDELIYQISEKMKKISTIPYNKENGFVEFYGDEIRVLWDDGLSNNDLGIVEALKIKKQVVLYGPPGTGKTYTAKKIAETLLSNIEINSAKEKKSETIQRLLSEKKDYSKQIDIVQFHPSFSYEDFIGGQTLLNENGVQQIKYKKGIFWNIIDKAEKDPRKGFVLILDEINRADLSRLMGECLNVLEYRGKENEISVPNTDEKFYIPSNLYIIGTMNEIDHSLERIDFAMRRRFIWIESNYESDALETILREDSKLKLKEDFLENLIFSAESLNNIIAKEFGNTYKIGHCYFSQITKYMEKSIKSDFEKAKSILWDYSIKPLIEQYSIETNNIKTIKDAEKSFKNVKRS